MTASTLNLNGKIIEMPKLKARMWREIMQFEEERKKISAVDAIEKYCEIIALAYDVTTDDVLDNLTIEEVVPKYYEIVNSLLAMLTAKLGDNKKNTDEKAET